MTHIRQLLGPLPLLAIAASIALVLSGCGDSDTEGLDGWSVGDDSAFGLSSSRSMAEERMAEDLEALLPGLWVWQEGSDQVESDLEITFLGHDARTGDVAMLVETGHERAVHPVRVVISESHGTLHFSDSRDSYVVERIDVDRLVLQDVATNARLLYRRVE